jgi:GTPase SAR1 family protein
VWGVQQEYHFLRGSHLRHGKAFLVCYSVVDQASFNEVRELYTAITSMNDGPGKVACVIVGCKKVHTRAQRDRQAAPHRHLHRHAHKTDRRVILASEEHTQTHRRTRTYAGATRCETEETDASRERERERVKSGPCLCTRDSLAAPGCIRH